MKNGKELTKQQFVLLDQQISQKQLYNDNVIVVFDEFHNGIIGIIAARITEKNKKPSIVISSSGTGSARSVNGSGFSIINVINKSELLIKYGGHPAAAGLSITPEEIQIQQFRDAVNTLQRVRILINLF
jgi:single-stranded-DNA-specific exonuclease